MAIIRGGHLETNSLYPNVDWYDEGNEVIDETTAEGKLLVEKCLALSPAYTLVKDADGRITDVVDDPVKRAELAQRLQDELAKAPPSLEERIAALEELELQRLFGGDV